MKLANQVFEEYLSKNGIRHSKPRKKILDIFLRTERHLTIVDIYDLARTEDKNIGYATVYRAMKIICEAGLAEEVDFGDGVARFEHMYGHEHHDHLICLECGKFVEIVNQKIEDLQKNVAIQNNFKLLRHKMYLFGICANCQKDK